MVFAPPQHGKTEIVSRRLPAYVLGRNPDANIIACSYADTLASDANRDVQRVMDTPEYIELFPETRLWGENVRTQAHGSYLRNSDVFEVVNHRGRYRAAGVGGGVTGLGADVAIIDDPIKDDEEAYSAVQRAKVLDWYRGTFYTRLRKDARVLLTMTRWHRGDLAGTLLAEALASPLADQWTVLSFPAVRGDKPCDYDPRQPDEPLWPEFKDAAALRTIQTTQGPTKWGAMYQQEPRAEGGAEWPESYFGPEIWFNDWPKDLKLKTIAWDPSKGKGSKWGDYSAVVAVGLSGSTLYVDAKMRNDQPIDQMVAVVVELCRVFHADAVGVEANQFQELLGGQLLQEARAAGVPFSPYLIDNRVNKEVRIRRLNPWLANGQIRFRGGSTGARLLVEQLKDFPNADHDDGPDALEMALRLMAELGIVVDDGLGQNLFTRG